MPFGSTDVYGFLEYNTLRKNMWVKDEAAQRCKASLTHGFLRNTLSRNHAQEMLSVIIPQIKQAISLATAVFAMFTFDRIAILKYFFFSRAFALSA